MSDQAIPLQDDPRLTTYAIGEMDAGKIAEFEALLAASPEAQAEVEAIRSMSETLGSEFSAELASVESETPSIAAAIDKPSPPARNVLRPPAWLFGAVAAGMAAMLTVTTLVHFKTSEPAPIRIVVDKAAPMDELEAIVKPELRSTQKDLDQSGTPQSDVDEPVFAAANESLDVELSKIDAKRSKLPQAAAVDGLKREGLVEAKADFRSKAKLVAPVDGHSGLKRSPMTIAAGTGDDADTFGIDGIVVTGQQTRTGGGEPSGSVQPVAPLIGLELEAAPARGPGAVTSPQPLFGKNAPGFEYRPGLGTVTLTQALGEENHKMLEDQRALMTPSLRESIALPNTLYPVGNRHAALIDNGFKDPLDEELSTFSIDVDTASYALLRRCLLNDQRWPDRDQLRIEELINYFDYDYPAPDLDEVEAGQVAPFAVSIDAGAAPWAPKHRLVRIGLKSAELKGERPAANLVFLVDVSGSMSSPDKLELVQKSLRELVPQLGAGDRVAIVAYAGRAGEVLEPTAGDDHQTINAAIDALSAGGSTNGAGGIKVAYQRAREHFVKDGVNRVILATDGDFNVGVSGDDELVQLIEAQAKSGVFLTVLGFGSGNLNDAMMEKVTNKGNGNYFYIDRIEEGRKVLVEQMAGTLVTVAKDVKIQVDFNPAKVASYRLIGYANRMLNREDFDNDAVDAGEIGAGHTVTALYEVVPVGVAQELTGAQQVDGLKYQRRLDAAAEQDLEAKRQQELAERGVELVQSKELLTVKLRYKRPAEDESALLEFPLMDRDDGDDEKVSDDFRFASAVAAFGMRLRESHYIDKQFSLEAIAELAAGAKGEDPSGRRAEFVEMVKRAAAAEPGAGEDVRRAVQEQLEKLR